MEDLYDLADKLPYYRAPDPWLDDRDVVRHVFWKYKLLPLKKKILKLSNRRKCRKFRRVK